METRSANSPVHFITPQQTAAQGPAPEVGPRCLIALDRFPPPPPPDFLLILFFEPV